MGGSGNGFEQRVVKLHAFRRAQHLQDAQVFQGKSAVPGPIRDSSFSHAAAPADLSRTAQGLDGTLEEHLAFVRDHDSNSTYFMYERKTDFRGYLGSCFGVRINELVKLIMRAVMSTAASPKVDVNRSEWTPRRPIIDDSGDAVRARINELRDVQGKTITEFAQSIGMTKQTFNNFMSGDNDFPVKKALNGCDKYGWSLDYIYRGDPRNLSEDLKVRLGFSAPI